MGKKKQVAIYLTDEVKEAAQKAAKDQGRSLNNYVEQLIKQDIKPS